MSKPQHDPPTSIRLPTDLKRSLKREAEKQERTLTSLVIYILRQWEKWKESKG